MMDYSINSYSVGYKYIPLFSLFHVLNQFNFDEKYPEEYKFNSHPFVTVNTFQNVFYPLRHTNGDNMTISTRQIMFSIYYGLIYLK